jgi:hypothetical protein
MSSAGNRVRTAGGASLSGRPVLNGALAFRMQVGASGTFVDAQASVYHFECFHCFTCKGALRTRVRHAEIGTFTRVAHYRGTDSV